ncbi:SDR family NAD(P)-dependent oxidoreductase [Egicoccus sp. AB-alg6-2]|uniref:SDR family NAD(P)-dependent oxidoreductase n=1 Tax=Egicoccus sp. AB-alg6-2 TaxID=3242692 RepID=UPI00359CD4A5
MVTGAGRNVGQAIAERFVAAGANVVIAERDSSRGSQLARQLNDHRAGAARFIPTDVADEHSVAAMVEASLAAFGSIDVLVNNVAATDRGHTVLDLDLDVWNDVLRVTLTSAYLCTKHVGAAMKARGGGCIVNIGSTSAHVGRGNAVAYGVAKAGLMALTRSCAAQLGQFGVRVNTVSPNKVGSPVGEDQEPVDRQRDNALGRGATPDDIAGAVLFMASESAGFVTGAELLVDGGALLRSGSA